MPTIVMKSCQHNQSLLFWEKQVLNTLWFFRWTFPVYFIVLQLHPLPFFGDYFCTIHRTHDQYLRISIYQRLLNKSSQWMLPQILSQVLFCQLRQLLTTHLCQVTVIPRHSCRGNSHSFGSCGPLMTMLYSLTHCMNFFRS